jgi:hypothetical protein
MGTPEPVAVMTGRLWFGRLFQKKALSCRDNIFALVQGRRDAGLE